MMTDEEKERECLFSQAMLGFMAAYCKGIFDLLIAKLAQKIALPIARDDNLFLQLTIWKV